MLLLLAEKKSILYLSRREKNLKKNKKSLTTAEKYDILKAQKRKENKEMTQKEYKELMQLIEQYGDACENFGDYNSKANSLNCDEAVLKIQNFLKKFVKNS